MIINESILRFRWGEEEPSFVRFMERFRSMFRMLWDHEPARKATGSSPIDLPTRKAGGTPARRRFMESPLLPVHTLWDHEAARKETGSSTMNLAARKAGGTVAAGRVGR